MATTSQSQPAKSGAPNKSSFAAKPAGTRAPRGNQVFLFDKRNYLWMAIGLVCIIIGFFLLSGGKSPDPHQFLYKEIYSFRRITLAPIVILIGFGIEAYAIMLKRPADSAATE
jgi:hypothetical protein